MKVSAASKADHAVAHLSRALGALADASLWLAVLILFPRSRAMRGPQRIVVHLVGNVGDIVVATPMLCAIRGLFPAAHIRLLTTSGRGSLSGAGDVLASVDYLDDITAYDVDELKRPRAALRMVRSLRADRPDLILFAPAALSTYRQLLRNVLFARAAGARRVVGLQLPTVRWGLRSQVRVRPFFSHESERFVGLLRSLGWSGPAPPARIGLPRDGSFARFTRDPFLAICPGGKQVPHRWPEDRFRAVVSAVVASTRLHVVAVGNEVERDLCSRVLEPAGSRGHNAAGQLSLLDTAALLAQAELLLTNDTGPMHLAAAGGTPLVALFGGANPPGRWFPMSPGAVVFRAESACRTCLGRADSPHCIGRIDTEAVIEATLNRLVIGRSGRELSVCYLPRVLEGDEPMTIVSSAQGWRRSEGQQCVR